MLQQAILGFGWFWAVFQSISGRLPERGKKNKEMIDKRKKCPNNPHPPTASAIGPCPTLTQISKLVGLVNGPLRQYFSQYRAVSQREESKDR